MIYQHTQKKNKKFILITDKDDSYGNESIKEKLYNLIYFPTQKGGKIDIT